MIQENMPLVNQLQKEIKKNKTRMHMPGHKGLDNINSAAKLLGDQIWKTDFTEISGLDNLQQPFGCIEEAQKLAASYYGAAKTYFLVNGTTVGIQAAIIAVAKYSSKIAVPRFVHKAAINGLILSGLDVVFLPTKVDEFWQIPLGVLIDDWEIALKDKNIKSCFATNPNYYGFVENLLELRHIAKDKILIIDEAHGSHFSAKGNYVLGGLQIGADIVIQSTHKTVGSLTQTSLLHLANNTYQKEIESAINLLQTTSPSYILMASLDGARHFWALRGDEFMLELLEKITKLRQKIRNIQGLTIVDEEIKIRNSNFIHDPTKLIISARDLGLSGEALAEILRKDYGIEVEMNDYFSVLFLFTIADIYQDFGRISNSLEKISKRYNQEKPLSGINLNFSINQQQVMSIREAYFTPKRNIAFRLAENCIAGEMVVPYPPGVPLLLPGEIITKEHIYNMECLLLSGQTCLGISNNHEIQVIDK